MAGLEQITMEIEILDWEQTRKIPPILFQFISFFQIISSSKEMEGALSRMRTLPWRGMFALFGGFLITVGFLSPLFFWYKIMMLWVVWCLIEISFFSCHWAPSIHSAIWWPTWHLIWGGKKHAKQTKCLRTISICLKIKSLIDRHHGSPNLTYGDFIIVQSVWGMTQVSIEPGSVIADELEMN